MDVQTHSSLLIPTSASGFKTGAAPHSAFLSSSSVQFLVIWMTAYCCPESVYSRPALFSYLPSWAWLIHG